MIDFAIHFGQMLKPPSSSNPFLMWGRNNRNAADLFFANHARSNFPSAAVSPAFRLPQCIEDINPYFKGSFDFFNTRYLPRGEFIDSTTSLQNIGL